MSTNISQQIQDPIELLRSIVPALQNGQKEKLTQAATLVKQLQAEHDQLKQALEAVPLPEAPASVNFRMVHTITQTECLFTLRGHSEADLQRRLERRISSLVDSGWVAFDVYVDQRRAEREANGNGKAAQTPPPALPAVPAVAAPPMAPQPAGELTFPAKTLAATVSGGKAYWKVKGGKFSTHGVSIWPEALAEAGFDPDQLDVMTVYNLEGYTVTYVTNDKGQPHKVVKLAR
ncbi:MAG: hypothetical protein KJ077_33705 [Anaerolineae bacterium]|nr:hypothetical protein [Anaerolineae bacterium]